MIVAIDGPAGAGKSTAARAVAAALGFAYLDSGAMYRAVALASLEDASRTPAEHAAALEISLGERVLAGARDITEAIRGAEVTARASQVAADPAVRAELVERQRELVASGDWVAEGRDIGTVVAPGARVKVFLEADAAVRAARRALETGASQAQTLAAQLERDARDRGRVVSPLGPAPDAVVIDTGGLDAGQVVERIVALVRRAQAPTHLFAGIPVADGERGREFYRHLLGRAPDRAPAPGEWVWQLGEGASIYVVADPPRAGGALVTLAVADLAAALARLEARGMAPERRAACGSRPSSASLTDPDGNAITLFEDPAAADPYR